MKTRPAAPPTARGALLLALAAAVLLPGCAPLVVGGAAAGAGSVAGSERGLSGTLSDQEMQGRIFKAWREADPEMARRLDVTINDRRALLTGVAADADKRVTAVRLAWQAAEITQVMNEIQVEGERPASGFGTDGWITTQLRGKLIGDAEIASLNYSIDTVNQVVYLMGHARNQAELDRVLAHARDIPRVLQVVSYVRL